MTAILERSFVGRVEPITLFPMRDERERATGKATGGGEAGRETTPSPQDLRLINALTRREFAAHELYVGYCDLANDQVDRSGEWFPPKILRQFAATAPGCSLMGGHDYQSLPLGTWFKAKVEKVGDVSWLRCWYYMPITDENAHARAMLDAGCYRWGSIGFNVADGASWEEALLICDLCGEDWYSWECPHWPLESYEVDGEQVVCTMHYEGAWRMVEGSIVYLGCQYDAQFKASAGGREMHKIEPALLAAIDQQAEATALMQAAAFQKSWDGLLQRRAKRPRPVEPKGAVPYKDEGIVEDREAEWDAAAEVAACFDGGDMERMRRMHTWYDAEEPDLKGSYKLPHHRSEDMKAVWRGVTAAAAVLQGGRGGVDIPEGDLDGVKEHIAKHYKEFDEEAPWVAEEAAPEPEQDAMHLALVIETGEAEEKLKALAALAERIGMKIGRVLSAANESALREVLNGMEGGAEKLRAVLAQVAEQEAEGEGEPAGDAAAPPETKQGGPAEVEPLPPAGEETAAPAARQEQRITDLAQELAGQLVTELKAQLVADLVAAGATISERAGP